MRADVPDEEEELKLDVPGEDEELRDVGVEELDPTGELLEKDAIPVEDEDENDLTKDEEEELLLEDDLPKDEDAIPVEDEDELLDAMEALGKITIL